MSDHGLLSRMVAALSRRRADALRAPLYGAVPRSDGAAALDLLAPPPPPMRDIAAEPYYRDPANSVVDPERFAANRAVVGPINAYVDRISALADAWISPIVPDPRVAQAALAWLDAWARAGAMLGAVTAQGTYHRKWALAGLALAWLDLRRAPGLDRSACRRVTAWMAALAAAMQPPYADCGAASVRNNHVCWAGLAAAAAAVAADDRRLLRWGCDRARIGLAEVAPDGTLPLEMARRAKALHYHLFAAAPLVVTAEIAAANGIELWEEAGGALRRLAERSLAGVEDPSWFAARAGSLQDFVGGALGGRNLAWVEPYFARFPAARRPALLAAFRPMIHPWLGGDLTLRYGSH